LSALEALFFATTRYTNLHLHLSTSLP